MGEADRWPKGADKLSVSEGRKYMFGRKKAMEITKKTTMGEMLDYDGGIAYVLMQSGMHCVGCPSSIHESLEEACMVHGLDSDEVLKAIQDYLASRK